MRTPSRVGWNESQASVRSFYNDCCRQSNTSEPPVCKKCGSEIATIVAFMDIHDERLRDSCAGPGRIWQLPIPYCPCCEARPSDRGCIRVPQAFTSSPASPSLNVLKERWPEQHPPYPAYIVVSMDAQAKDLADDRGFEQYRDARVSR